MSKLEKYQTLIIFAAMPIGFGLGQITFLAERTEHFVSPFLFVMLFGAFLNIPLRDFRRAFANVKFTATTVGINFIWTPILVWLLGKIFLSHSTILQIGFIMLMVTPCTDWYLIFTGIAKGNVPLSASVLPANLILQIVLMPAYLLIFGSASGAVNLREVLMSITFMLILPFALAQLVKLILGRLRSEARRDKVLGVFSSSTTILLALAVMSMFIAKGRDLLANLGVVAVLLIPIVLFYIINFGLAHGVGRVLKYDYADTTSLTLTTIAKNSPMTLGVALLAFPNEPLIHLIMLIEPLIELPVMLLITRILLAIRRRREKEEVSV